MRISVYLQSEITHTQRTHPMTYSIAISDAEQRFSEVLEKIRNGDSIILNDEGTIIARIIPENPQIPADSKVARLIGLLPSQLDEDEIKEEYHTFCIARPKPTLSTHTPISL